MSKKVLPKKSAKIDTNRNDSLVDYSWLENIMELQESMNKMYPINIKKPSPT